MLEQKADKLNQSMLFLLTLKNETAKKDLRLACSQGNNTAYPTNTEAMARYLSTQYPNNKAANQRGAKKGEKRGMHQNLKTRIVPPAALPVHMLKIPRQLKNPLFLAELLV